MWGQLKRQCLDLIGAEPDEVCIAERVQNSFTPSHDPPNYESLQDCAVDPFPHAQVRE